jgi:hypothetical protein
MGLWTKKEPPASGDQSKSEADELIAKLGPAIGAAIEEKIKPISEGFTALKSEWDGLKADATKSLEPDPNKNSDGSDLTDEQKSTRERAAMFAMTVQTNARITENDCIASIQSEYPQLVAELRATFQQTPWQRKAEASYQQYCQNCVDMLVGREARKSGLRHDKNSNKFFIEDAAAASGGKNSMFLDSELTWRDDRSDKTLTATQQLDKLHIDPKQFEEFMKREAV